VRLYSLTGADSHVDPVHGRFTPDETGGFPFPDEVSDTLVTFAVRGRKLWETEETRAERMHGLEMARRRDPASMLTVMEENAALVRQLTELTAALAAAQLGKAAPPAAAEDGEGEPPAPRPAPQSRRGAAPKGAAAKPEPAPAP
jgi:hypothetical protein